MDIPEFGRKSKYLDPVSEIQENNLSFSIEIH
jgi:hypothetical protein